MGNTNDRFQRWQSVLREHFTFVLNLFFGISGGALVFSISLIRDEGFILSGTSKVFFQACLLTLLVSVFINIAAEISRLLDFKYTFWKIRADEKNDYQNSAIYEHVNKALGKLTWRLFWFQLFFLMIGLLCLIVSINSAYSTKIW